ncbi:integrase arm-type DNA-binding domain-containing protein [Roseibium aggregatum]|nr:integrase arm-type DNA-binding domain-containing protein [Roseibium aggregatum]
MARSLHKLTAEQVSSIKDAGRYSDGGGLYLRVADTGLKRWVLSEDVV